MRASLVRQLFSHVRLEENVPGVLTRHMTLYKKTPKERKRENDA
jgi:hypothetical protein